MTDGAATPQLDIEQVKAEAIKAAQEAMVARIQGDKPKFSWEERGDVAPKTYDELFDEVKNKISPLSEDDVRAKAREEFERLEQDRDKQRKEQEEVKKKEQVETMETKHRQFDSEWYQLVEEGKMPAPSKEIQERINKGEKIPTSEIEADEGLNARMKLYQLSDKKGAKLAYYEDYNKEPAGSKAPVFGGRPSAGARGEEQELSYDDVVKNRKKMFGY